MSRSGPNFLLFVTDQQRADHLGCESHPVLRTPHLDALARQALPSQRVDMWRAQYGIARAAQVIRALLVGDEQQEVRARPTHDWRADRIDTVMTRGSLKRLGLNRP